MPQTLVILPAYNEAKNLPALLERFAALDALRFSSGLPRCKLILVDDGSSDETTAAALSFQNRLDILVEKHEKNKGLGQALRTGLGKALSLADDGDCVVTMDADNSHPPELIPALSRKISEGCDVAIGSRYETGGKEVGLSFHRHFLSAGANRMLRVLFGVKGVRDYTCGYRVYGVPALKKLAAATNNLFYEEEGFVCMAELLIRLARLGAVCSEVPLELRYDLKAGESKMKIGPTVLRYFFLIYRLKSTN